MSNTRVITAAVAFAVTFIFSAGLVRIIFGEPQVSTVYDQRPQYSKRYIPAMQEFLINDERYGDRKDEVGRLSYANGNLYSGAYADATMGYYNTSSKMDATRFPQDFQNAWKAHMQAWYNYAIFLEGVKSPSARKNVSYESLLTADQNYTNEINSSYEEVLRIARTYGVETY